MSKNYSQNPKDKTGSKAASVINVDALMKSNAQSKTTNAHSNINS